VGEVLQRNDIRERLAGSGLDPSFAAAREFQQFLRDEVERWTRVVKASGMRVE
jgi:tripartite-type tricarboxylate transporter receptor subunit TctC